MILEQYFPRIKQLKQSKFLSLLFLFLISGLILINSNKYAIEHDDQLGNTPNIQQNNEYPIDDPRYIARNYAPTNLTGLVINNEEWDLSRIKVLTEQFKNEWERIFNKSLPIIILATGDGWSNTNLSLSNISLLNGTLFINNARYYLGLSESAIPNLERNQTALMPWSNDTIGNGWLLYSGSDKVFVQAYSYFGSTLDQSEIWNSRKIITLQFPFLLGNFWGLGEGTTIELENNLNNFESMLQKLVKRGFTACEIFVQYEKFVKYDLPGYSEPINETVFNNYVWLLKNYIQIAANYEIELYFNTDELSLTEAQYNWLMENLNYSGPAAKDDYPDHLSTNAPGLWTYWEGKYSSIAQTIKSWLNDTNRAGFGGFYFRTDDQSNPYKYTFNILPTNNSAFQRFINITLAAANILNASVIQRIWRLGEEENVFNNATLAKQLLDPIKDDNLIIRCKETYNDHWYNHPPNPVIGVSHHKWIIGWYIGAAMPDYKGEFFDEFFKTSGWEDNPNIIGYDAGVLASTSFQRLDLKPFFSANGHYLYLKRWNRTINGNQTLEKYFHQVGIFDQYVINKLTDVFNDVHNGFKLISFWKGWAASGKFTGDVLNGGNTLLFEPGRFNKFYEAIQDTPYGNDYTIAEAFEGRDYIKKAFGEFPDSINGWGNLPPITEGYLDPEYASEDPTNMTLQLMVLRGIIRQFADMSDIFANYRAWHIKYYEWGHTGNPISFVESEKYRKATMDAYHSYQEVWGHTNYWYQVNFRTMGEYWIPLIGNLDNIRLQYIWLIIGSISLIALGLIIYKPIINKLLKNNKLSNKLLKKLFRQKNDKKLIKKERISQIKDFFSETGKESREYKYQKLGLVLFGGFVVPFYNIVFYFATFNIIPQGIFPELQIAITKMIISIQISVLLSVIIIYLLNRKRIKQSKAEYTRKIKTSEIFYLSGIQLFGATLIQLFLGVSFFVAGAVFLTATIWLDIIVASIIIIGIIWNFLLLNNVLQINNWLMKMIFLILVLIFTAGIFQLILIPSGGIATILESISNNMF